MRSYVSTTFVTLLLPFLSCPHSSTPHISTLSLHDALPICHQPRARGPRPLRRVAALSPGRSESGWPGESAATRRRDRKSTRLNSSHRCISYAVFCLKKKKKKRKHLNNQPIKQ